MTHPMQMNCPHREDSACIDCASKYYTEHVIPLEIYKDSMEKAEAHDPDIHEELKRLLVAVDQFAAQMKVKLYKKALEGLRGWDNEHFVNSGEAHTCLLEHATGIPKDMVDVANFAMFIWALEQKEKEERK